MRRACCVSWSTSTFTGSRGSASDDYQGYAELRRVRRHTDSQQQQTRISPHCYRFDCVWLMMLCVCLCVCLCVGGAGRTMITTGEHEYTRYGFRQLLTNHSAGTFTNTFSSICFLHFISSCVMQAIRGFSFCSLLLFPSTCLPPLSPSPK